MSNIAVYFAVNKYGSYMYLDEKFEEEPHKNQSRLMDIIDDSNALESELAWDKMIEADKPNVVGIYEAVVMQVQTAEDDFRLDVISCIPVYTLKK